MLLRLCFSLSPLSDATPKIVFNLPKFEHIFPMTNLSLIFHCSEDRAGLSKLVDAIRTNFNERGEEVISLIFIPK